jgi:hypothetical protein
MEFCFALVKLTLANKTIFGGGEGGRGRYSLIKDVVSVHVFMLEL